MAHVKINVTNALFQLTQNDNYPHPYCLFLLRLKPVKLPCGCA